ncbi:MAG: hypothetical protein IDH49_08420 [Gammaproteobacteria bacterium]|nr:hypothetical protein [Gammaproteobacteria bacterium]
MFSRTTTIVRALGAFSVFSLFIFPLAASSATSNVGATAGSFAVGPTGAATYTIPLTLPPGVNGMQPALALAYNSQGGNGLAGMGWNLAGLSAIHRCAATIDQDGYKGGVNLDANDRLCLDGQRLVPLNGSSYWSASEYRTEIETYTRIAPYNGGYRAWTKAGQIIDYGATDNARQQGSTGAVISWAMNQVQDRSGNYLTVSYNKNAANGEHYPQRIDYTANASTGLAANRAVVFGYEGRSDVETAYVGGVKTQTAVRLNRVQAWLGTGVVREYRLTYDASAATGRSRVVGVQECGGDGVCLGTTVLGWAGGGSVFERAGITATGLTDNGGWNDGQRYFQMDVNGDGKGDLVARDSAGNLLAYLSNGATFSQAGITATGFTDNGGWNSGQRYFQMDVNGDGKGDLVARDSAGNLLAYLSNGATFSQAGITATGFTDNGGWNDGQRYFQMDVNGDGKGDLVARDSAGNLLAYLSNGTFPDLLTSLTPALGAQTTITYKPLTDPSVYTPGGTTTALVLDVHPRYLVSSHSASNGIGGMNASSYSYTDASVQKTGRGFLGFRSVTATGPDGIKTTSYYHQNYPYTGLPQQVDVQQPNNSLLRRTVNTWTAHNLGGGRYFPYVASSTESAWELNGAALPTAATTSSYDLLGNATAVTFTASDGHRTSTANTYNNDTNTWLLGQLTQAQVTRALPNGQFQTRASTFGYDSAGRLTREVIEPNTVFTLTTDYGYDAHGHRNRVTVSGAGIVARATATDYLTSPGDPWPRIRTTNALGHTEVQTLDARFGAPVSLTGPNGLTTTWAYDGFGRKVRENRADGTSTTWSFGWCPSAACPSNARTLATAQSSGSAPVTTYYDLLGREVRSHTLGFTGQTVYKDTQYDSLGRLQYASQPYFAGGVAYWGVMSYDLLGRPVTETAPDGGVTRTTYQGLTTAVTNPLNQTTTRVKNSQGQLLQVSDALGSLTRYSYDPFGNLIQTVDPKSNIATLTYDIRGRKRSMTDPDMGYWEYKYNVLGELTSQMDAKAQTVTMEYDLLGRLVKRTEPEGVSQWTYDTAAQGKGKLAQLTGPGGYKQTTVYDALSRPVRVSTVIDNSGAAPFDLDTGYDALGRVGAIAYPAVNGNRFTVHNAYTAQGHLSEVKNAATGQSYWKANARDAAGRLTAEILGNGLSTVRTWHPANGALQAINTGATVQSLGYTYDLLGNLTRRADAINGVTETFTYDALNRLTSVSGPAPKTYAYDSIGNITSKSDVGTYTYGAKPHTVTATAGAINATYTYDANGNMTGGNGRYYVDYTSFNLPMSVAQGSTRLEFSYGPDRQRTRQARRSTGFPSVTYDTTVYVNPRWDSGIHYEMTGYWSGQIEHRHYIYAGNTPIALYTVGGPVPQVNQVRYLHKDHLGSIDTITDETGKVVERLSYDAFGKRRQPNGQDAANLGAATTHHGYTGHEHLDSLGLIHMNGRLYDPNLARFTQADPYIQNPANLQDLNRYSYVNNNPLKYTDPSGYKKFWKNITLNNAKDVVEDTWKSVWQNPVGRTAIAAMVGWYLGPWVTQSLFSSAIAGTSTAALTTGGPAFVNGMWVASNIVGGAAGGFSSTYVMTGGDFNASMRGGLSGGIFGGIGGYYGNTWNLQRVAANSFAGGVSSELMGGRFGQGFRISMGTGLMSWGYSAMVGYKADPLPGKSDPNHTTYDPRVYPAGPQGMDVSGFNVEGRCFLCQGGIGGRTINALPGGQAVSHLDDWFNNIANRYYPGLGDTQWLKGVTIPAAVVIAFPALLDGPMAVNLSVGRQ